MIQPTQIAEEKRAERWWKSLSPSERRDRTDDVERLYFNQGLEVPKSKRMVMLVAYDIENA